MNILDVLKRWLFAFKSDSACITADRVSYLECDNFAADRLRHLVCDNLRSEETAFVLFFLFLKVGTFTEKE
ncbi:hypothetical protein HanRHA438_Chr17g0794881 [Helianthus annuus]|nr:hypothetical protein HanRHA438_Chr17g0794881 [Helianthus annuus]